MSTCSVTQNLHHRRVTKKRRKVLAIVFIGAIAGVAAYGLLRPKDEPKYQGRDLSDWLQECSGPFSGGVHPPCDAEAAVRHIGTNALPYLEKWIVSKPPAWRTNLGEGPPNRSKPDPLADWLDGSGRRRRNAYVGFWILGTNAASSVPELMALMKGATSSNEKFMLTFALAGIGAPAIPALKAALTDPNQPHRSQIFVIFFYMAGWHGPNDCLPVLIELLNHNDFMVRSGATNWIEEFNPQFFPAAPATNVDYKLFTTNISVIFTNAPAK
jgi:hypothetical protein